MLTATVLICALAMPCDRVVVPGQFSNPATCAAYSQAYIAATVIAIEGRTVTVRCRPAKRVASK